MQKPPKKRARRPAKRSTLLLGMLLLLAAGAAFLLIARQRAAAPKEIPSQPNTRAVLFAYEENQVERVEVETRDYGGYQLVRSDGELRLVGDPEAKLDATLLKAILADCAAIAIEDTLKEDWREEEGPTLAQLGLDPPRVRVSVWYDTGEKAAFSVGDKAPMREAYYFLMDNDSRLYLAGSRYLTDFELDERTLLDTPSPTLDANRMNAIAFTDESGNLTAAWERRDELGWRVTAPVSYPAQEDAMEKVCANIAGIRLGVHIAQAGDADLAAYGMEAPASLKVHMAAGPMGQVDGEGVYSTVSMPEEDFVFYLGESVDEFSQYVMYEGEIYLCSRFLIQFLDGLSWEATLDPLPAAVDIDLLESLTVEKDGHKTVYRLSREPRVMENNDLETDSSGNVVYDTLVAENGESMAFSAFEARYEQFSAVRMSGRLNENYDPPSEPSAKYTLVTTGGAKRELTLYAYDAFHDAVGVDGVFLCYLIKGGLSF